MYPFYLLGTSYPHMATGLNPTYPYYFLQGIHHMPFYEPFFRGMNGYFPFFQTMPSYYSPFYRMPPSWQNYQSKEEFERIWDSPESPQSPWIKVYGAEQKERK
ncbi:hypothetical protein [Thermoflavimicrobium daqui]|jgi:hypothetical protein|uniref:Uncharacterized protein n=1 Tax=Thermoflavimicrobium daqui TaxID=2137476 RepID=A0A364K5V0_9BACL|nr:hypothetical protein [Thermoflavimicrobium daqui]RAL25685.1 hypothetical protein DL897_06305 [Thermoflavimicrobium daqui]